MKVTIRLAALVLLASCTRALVPSGKPSCPNKTVWVDSVQRCVTK